MGGPSGLPQHPRTDGSIDHRRSTTEAHRRGRASAFLFRHRRAQLTFTLGPTLAWMIVIYLFSLAVLLVISSLWSVNPLTSQIEHVWTLSNYQTILHSTVYWKITFRTVILAARSRSPTSCWPSRLARTTRRGWPVIASGTRSCSRS